MEAKKIESGFTIVEMVVTLIVLSLFLTVFFQLFIANESQRAAVMQRAAADDIAKTNLNKVTTKTNLPACTSGASSAKNIIANPSAAGSIIATNEAGGTPTWASASMSAEPTDETNLPSNTIQELRVLYPRDCHVAMPATIISTVKYGSETVRRAIFIN